MLTAVEKTKPKAEPATSAGGLTHYPTVCLAMVTRIIGGMAAFLPLVIVLSDQSTWLNPVVEVGSSGLSLFTVSVIALLVGMAVSPWLQRMLVPSVGAKMTWVVLLACVGCGIGTLAWCQTTQQVALSRLLCGVGIGGQWSAAADVARRSVTNLSRWKTNLILNLGFLTGALIVIGITVAFDFPSVNAGSSREVLISLPILRVSAMPLVMATVCVSMLVLMLVPNRKYQSAVEPMLVPENMAAGCCEEASDSESKDAGAACDTGGCCGPTAPAKTPVLNGVVLAALGSFVIWGLAVVVVHRSMQSEGNVEAAIILLATAFLGMILGQFLLQSFSVNGGYAVMMILFLLFATPVTIAGHLMALNTIFVFVLTGAAGIGLGAVHAACDAIVGESYAGDGSEERRTKVRIMGGFASALLVLGYCLLLNSGLPNVVTSSVVCVILIAGLWAIRTMPHVMLSGRTEG